MIHVLLRVVVWVVVLGIGYLVFGPQLFDSSRSANPFGGEATIFLPPAKTDRQIDFEELMETRKLDPEELAEYESLVVERKSRFWQREGVPVEEALSGVKQNRRQHLASILAQRGVSSDEAAIFFMVVERDHPELLDDRD